MVFAIVLILLVIGSVLFHFLSPWYLTPLASNWSAIDDTLDITFLVTGFVFVAVNVFLAYCVYKFRHKKGRLAHYEPENKKLEIWLTVLTSIGVAAMLTPGLYVWADFINPPEDADIVEVVGKQWQWSYRFPGADGKLGTVDTRHTTIANPFGMNPDDPHGQDDVLVMGNLHLPIDQPVKMLLRSQDVLHDFAVAQFRVKMDLVPGHVTSLWFTPTVLGKYDVLCEELCGVGHYNMRSYVVVETRADFEAWLSDKPTYAQSVSADSATATASADEVGPIERGRLLATSRGCVACHSTNGTSGIGPTWRGLFGKTEALVDGSTIVVDEDYFIESIIDPATKVVEGYAPIMPPSSFTDAEMEALIAYVRAL